MDIHFNKLTQFSTKTSAGRSFLGMFGAMMLGATAYFSSSFIHEIGVEGGQWFQAISVPLFFFTLGFSGLALASGSKKATQYAVAAFPLASALLILSVVLGIIQVSRSF